MRGDRGRFEAIKAEYGQTLGHQIRHALTYLELKATFNSKTTELSLTMITSFPNERKDTPSFFARGAITLVICS